MRQRNIALFYQGEEGAQLRVRAQINRKAGVSLTFGFLTREEATKYRKATCDRFPQKEPMRARDREWCLRNIPSSIIWKVDIHHDWENGGTMYLLDPDEHKKVTIKEVMKNGRRKRI